VIDRNEIIIQSLIFKRIVSTGYGNTWHDPLQRGFSLELGLRTRRKRPFDVPTVLWRNEARDSPSEKAEDLLVPRDILEGKGVLENSCVSAFEEFGQFIQEVN
jgi:hypothetical protein